MTAALVPAEAPSISQVRSWCFGLPVDAADQAEWTSSFNLLSKEHRYRARHQSK